MCWFFRKSHGYFCGRYILRQDRYLRLLPDPLKIITKLGCKAIKDWDHLEEFRVSLFDMACEYKNSFGFDVLESAVKESFPKAEGCNVAFCAIYKFLSNKYLFRTLFSDV